MQCEISDGLEWAGASVTGPVRAENQDRFVGDPHAGVFIVADGIGGSAGGDIAAQTVVELFPEFIRQFSSNRDQWHNFGTGAERTVTAALVALSQAVHGEGVRSVRYSGMGSTVVSALIEPREALVVHLGDSRAYLVQNGRMKRLTRDHNLARALVELDELSTDEAERHTGLQRLTSFVGMDQKADPDVVRVPFGDGDRIVLCSDGLTSMVSDIDIEAILARHPSAQDACQSLINAANNAGGRDNTSVIVIQRAMDSRGTSAMDLAHEVRNWEQTTEILSPSMVKVAPFDQPTENLTHQGTDSGSGKPNCSVAPDATAERCNAKIAGESAPANPVSSGAWRGWQRRFLGVIDAFRY